MTPGRLEFVDIGPTSPPATTADEQIAAANEELTRLYDAAQLLRSLPPAAVPDTARHRLTALLAASGLG